MNPYRIIPKDVFEGLAGTGDLEILENRLRFNNTRSLLEKDSISERTKFYLNRIGICMVAKEDAIHPKFIFTRARRHAKQKLKD